MRSPGLHTRRILPGLALTIAACAGLMKHKAATPPPPAPVDHIKVPHDKHTQAKVDCVSCHEGIWDATDLFAKDILPDEAKCLECHAEEKEKGNCGMCHTDVSHAASFAKRDRPLRVSHADHLKLVKDDCTRCHKQLPNPVRTEEMAAPMNACLTCHEHSREYAEARCTGCHPDLSRFALKPVADFSHQGDFLKHHAGAARASAETCAQCHDQTFCAECHAKTVSTPIEVKYPERVASQFVHRNDWLGRHSVEAAADEASCKRCHGSSFCESCHQRENLVPTAANPRDPHPPGWAFPASANFHGPAARRDIASCAACHDQGAQSNCIGCHKVGGIGGNPHPPSWLSRHDRNEIRSNGMCSYCH